MLYITVLFTFLFIVAAIRIASAGQQGLQLYAFDLRETLPLRGILAVSVFLTHLCPHLDEASPWLKDFGNWGPPSVACFFLLAGYGLAYSVKTKGPAYLDGFFRKRLSRLIWPFAVMAVIYQSYKEPSVGTACSSSPHPCRGLSMPCSSGMSDSTSVSRTAVAVSPPSSESGSSLLSIWL